jgi:ADP-ribosylglycohydrolase
MRAYPFGLVFAGDLERAETWAVAHSRLTHGHPMALAACAAMAVGVAHVMSGTDVAGVTGAMEAAARRYDAKTACGIAAAVADARSGIGPDQTLDRNRGWRADEAIAAATYLFVCHPDDPRRALLEGANTPGDSDSIATLAGALVGGSAGSQALPEEWIRDLERVEDLGRLADRT